MKLFGTLALLSAFLANPVQACNNVFAVQSFVQPVQIVQPFVSTIQVQPVFAQTVVQPVCHVQSVQAFSAVQSFAVQPVIAQTIVQRNVVQKVRVQEVRVKQNVRSVQRIRSRH